jgi:hypothetical protein
MTMGAWRRWGSPPTADQMALGITVERRHLWLSLTRWLAATYGLEGELTWMDEEAGWVLRFRRRDRALTTLMPNTAGGFGALVVVPPSVLDAALAAPLSDATRETLAYATAYADGRWLWLRVADESAVEDIETLILLKSRPGVEAKRGRDVAGMVRDLAGVR